MTTAPAVFLPCIPRLVSSPIAAEEPPWPGCGEQQRTAAGPAGGPSPQPSTIRGGVPPPSTPSRRVQPPQPFLLDSARNPSPSLPQSHQWRRRSTPQEDGRGPRRSCCGFNLFGFGSPPVAKVVCSHLICLCEGGP